MNQNVSSFDAAAKSYDEEFTFSEIGKRQRERVFYWLEKSKALSSVKNIFEVNCGTGHDAEWFHNKGYNVIATDVSAAMIKVSKAARNKGIYFYQRNMNEIAIDDNVGHSDFVFSNFGGLNCLSETELSSFFNELALKQKPRDRLAVVIMSNYCVVEDFYLLLKGKFSQIGRRDSRDFVEVDVNGEKVKTFYHSPNRVKKLLDNYYKVQMVKPVAHFLPPSYLEPFFKKNLWLLNWLSFLERTFGSVSVLAKNADHYIIIAERR
jgi:trans-aconitate methyltransferase